MKPGIVQRIFTDHFGAIEASRPLDSRSRWAAWNILTCRTPWQGYHVDACPNGDYRIHLNNSCRHRACPQCGATIMSPRTVMPARQVAIHRNVLNREQAGRNCPTTHHHCPHSCMLSLPFFIPEHYCSCVWREHSIYML